ncbi:MAG: tail fiber domain-containing protein [Rhodanobacteraceae bacterium]
MKETTHTRSAMVAAMALALAGSVSSASAGGIGSTVGGGVGNSASGDYSTVSGGISNHADGNQSTAAGGAGNYARGLNSVVPGGASNFAGGNGSFAAGFQAHIRSEAETGICCGGDQGTFFWSDAAGFPPLLPFQSTGPDQFIAKANGGFSLNAAPTNPGIEMTIAASLATPGYASIHLMDHSYRDGILITSGDAHQGANDAAFYIDQYNGILQSRRLTLDAVGKLTISNQAYKPGGGSWAASSDARLKSNVQPMTHALDRLLALKGVTFEYAHPDGGMHPSGIFSGFIAQEVEKVFPGWIGHDNDGYLTVGSQGFEALAVEALRELKLSQNKRVTALERDNADLRELVTNQAKALSDLRREVAAVTNATELKSQQIAAVDNNR